jgi:hypothetical protein
VQISVALAIRAQKLGQKWGAAPNRLIFPRACHKEWLIEEQQKGGQPWSIKNARMFRRTL